MLLDCPTVTATFPSVGFSLKNAEPGQLQWDQHGDTFILKVTGLEVTSMPQEPREALMELELNFSPPESLIREIETFAAAMHLDLSAKPPSEFDEKPILAACHLPEAKLFVFSEEASLIARPAGPNTIGLAVTGPFRSQRVPCRETDLVIHLEKGSCARLLSFLLALAREKV